MDLEFLFTINFKIYNYKNLGHIKTLIVSGVIVFMREPFLGPQGNNYGIM